MGNDGKNQRNVSNGPGGHNDFYASWQIY
jgi:hypothetical protein